MNAIPQFGLLICLLTPLGATAGGHTIECRGFEGSRIDYSIDADAPTQFRHKLWRSDDQIDGMVARISWQDESKTGYMTLATSGVHPQNPEINKYDLLKIEGPTNYLSFVARPRAFGATDSVTLLSYFPAAKRLIWSDHYSKLAMVPSEGAHGLVLMADCK